MKSADCFVILLYFFSWGLVNIPVPLIHDLMQALDVPLSAIRLSITCFFLVFSASQIIWGVLSDHFGRRAIILVAFTIALVGSLMSALTSDYAFYLAGQILAGLGAGACPGLGRSILADVYDRKELPRLMSWLTVTLSVTPAIAVWISVRLDHGLGWRGPYWYAVSFAAVMLLYGVFGLRETLKTRTESLHPRHWLRSFKYCLGIRQFSVGIALFGLTGGFMLGAVYPVLSLLLVKDLGMTKITYSHWLLVPAACYFVGGFFSRWMCKCFELHKSMYNSMAMQTLFAIIMALWIGFAGMNQWSLMIPLSLLAFAFSTMTPVANAISMLPLVKHRGTGGSLVGAAVALMSTVYAAILSLFDMTTAWPLIVLLLLTILVTYVVYHFGFGHQQG